MKFFRVKAENQLKLPQFRVLFINKNNAAEFLPSPTHLLTPVKSCIFRNTESLMPGKYSGHYLPLVHLISHPREKWRY